MNSNSLFSGVITAIVTPFQEDGSIDWEAYSILVERQIKAGIHAIVPNGTTGESPTLSTQEKETLFRRTVELCKGSQTRVLAGTGSNSTADSIALSKIAVSCGVDGVLLVVPYYNKPTQEGLIAHFTAIATAVPSVEAVLYNVPGRTITSLEARTIATLAKQPNIRAIKEATGDLKFLNEIQTALKATSQTLNFLSGDDPTYLPFLERGGDGIISVVSNVFPKTFLEIYNMLKAGDKVQAVKLFTRFLPFSKALFMEPNPVPVKYALSIKKLCKPIVRLPLVEASLGTQEALQTLIEDLRAFQ